MGRRSHLAPSGTARKQQWPGVLRIYPPRDATELKSLFSLLKASPLDGWGYQTHGKESLTRGKWCEKSLVAGTPPHLTAPLCLASSEWRTPSSPRPPRAHGQQRRRSRLLHWHLRARQPTQLMASELWTPKSFFHKLLILVMRPKEKSRAKEWPWRSVRHTALGTEPVPLQSSGAGGRRGWGRR